EEYQAVALVDQSNIAALPALLASANIRFHGVARETRLPKEDLGPAPDGVVTRTHQHLARTLHRPLKHLAGRAAPPRRWVLVRGAIEIKRPRQRLDDADTRRAADAADGRLDVSSGGFL